VITGPARRMVLAAAGLLLVASPGAGEEDLAALVSGYLKAGPDRAGAVTARAYVEPSRPAGAPTPQPGVSLVLLPYSARLEAELDAAKASFRESVEGITRAVARVESARVDYERALVAAGGGALVRSGLTDGEGRARLGEVPPGDWLLLAWQEGGHFTKRFKLRDQDARRYSQVPTTVTYSTVTYWRSRIVVRPAEVADVSLSDRNVWLTAAREESGKRRQPTLEPGLPERR
jgi:hypothetical protein